MKPLGIFYLLVIYIILQFTWWAYLLVELNKEVITQKIELANSKGEAESEAAALSFNTQLHEREVMVLGEGIVFLAILLFGIYKTRGAFRKEFALARQQKNFLLSITHEFKSPLAAVKLNLQTLQKRQLSKPQQELIISKAIGEADRINNLIENALMAARIESHSFNLHSEEFNLSELITSVIQSRTIPGAENIRVQINIEQGIYMSGDALAIASLVLNLVENAEKYSSENTPISLSLRQNKNQAILTVADCGIGIADSEKSKIFDKFYRVGNEDTRKTKGTGLGLFIVKYIVDYHHGDIKVEDNHPSGTIFRVTLPAA
jgi:two-component system, OmpR family, phosphate regulon sensor histidine kinase PhoR